MQNKKFKNYNILETNNRQEFGLKTASFLMDYFKTPQALANASITEILACFSNGDTAPLIKEIRNSQGY